MFATVSVELSTTALAALLAHSERSGSTLPLSDAIAAAVDFWLENQNRAPEDQESRASGYQWKSQFLPEGTLLRSWSYGEHRYACVEGDRLMYEGRSVSPNQFARSFARSTRNAWTDLSVRRPGEKTFQLASALRKQIAGEKRNAPAVLPVDVPVAPPQRNTLPATGWDLPERRTMRYRLEDVAFS